MSDLTLITGASGFIGSHLTRALLLRGDRVRALAVDEAAASAVRALGAETVVGNLLDRGSLERAVAGASKVYHLAAQVRPGKSLDSLPGLSRAYHETNVVGTLNLVSACQKRIREFIFFSSIAAVGTGSDLDEDSPCRPTTDYGKSKREAEQALLDAFRRERFPVKIIRPGQVYGPGNLPMRLFFKFVKHGFLPLVGSGDNHIPFCYVEDVVKAALLIEERGSVGEAYFAVGEPTTFRQFVQAIATAMGKAMPAFAVPAWAFRAGARAKDFVERAIGLRFFPLRLDFGVNAVAIAASEWSCRNRKIKEKLGFGAPAELAACMDSTVRWYEANRLI